MIEAGRSPTLWAAADPGDLLWVHWPDGAALLHRPSGKTHFLNPASVYLLERLSLGALDGRDAAEQLARHELAEPTAEFAAQVEAVLWRFQQLGLVRCRPA